jgi:hypothetical protein
MRRSFELKPVVSPVSGRDISEFGTVRPRVQIPGPRPFLSSKSVLMTHSMAIFSQEVTVSSQTSSAS